MTTGPGNYVEVDPDIHAIPIEGAAAGVDADKYGAALAKQYLLPGRGELAGAVEEYITPADVGHAFDVIYRDMKALGGGDVIVSQTAGETPQTAVPAGSKKGDVFVNRPDGKAWIYDGTTWQPLGGAIGHGANFPGLGTAAKSPGQLQPDQLFVLDAASGPELYIGKPDGTPVQVAGPQGPAGAQGPPGPAPTLGTAVANPVAAGGAPTVTATGGGAQPVVFTFGIPAGATGATGADGASVLSGTGVPATGTGNDGDFYIDTADPAHPTLYGPKTGGAWPGTGQDLRGPAGTGISVKGTVDNANPLPTGGSVAPGDLYIVGATPPTNAPTGTNNPGDGLVWDGNAWKNVGPVRGPIGPTGPTGATGNTVQVRVGDGKNGATGQIYTAPVAAGATAPAFTGATPTGWTSQGSILGPTGPQGDSAHTHLGQNGDAAGILYVFTGAAAPSTAGDAGPGATGQDAALQNAGWTPLGSVVGPTGPDGHTPAVITATDSAPNAHAPDPAAGQDGDIFIQTQTAGTGATSPAGAIGEVWVKSGGTWGPSGNIRGPMGPAITVQGPLDLGAVAGGATFPDTAPAGASQGDAYIVQGGLPAGQTMPAWIPAAQGQTNPQDGDFLFFDGTNWHNGGSVQGPQGTQGPAATVTAEVLTAADATKPNDPDGNPAAAGDLIVTINGTESNLGSVVGPQGAMPEIALGVGQAGPPAIGVSNHLYYQAYAQGATAPTFPTTATDAAALGTAGWVDAGLIPTAPSVNVTTDATAGNTPATGPTTGQRGDVFINTADGLTWIHDGTTWQPVGSPGPTVTTDATAGHDPANPSGGFTPPANPASGDVFVNTADNATWLYDGTAWQPIGGGGGPTVTTDATAGNTPATGPTAGAEGDVFINTADGLTWIHDGTAWQEVVTRQPTFHFAADATAAAALDAGKPGNGVAVGDMIIQQNPLVIYSVAP